MTKKGAVRFHSSKMRLLLIVLVLFAEDSLQPFIWVNLILIPSPLFKMNHSVIFLYKKWRRTQHEL